MDYEGSPEYWAICKLIGLFSLSYANEDFAAARKYQRRGIRRVRKAMKQHITPVLWNQLADLYVQPHKCLECYRRALRLDPNNVEACYEMARYELDWRQRPRRALAWVERYMEHLKDGENVDTFALDLAAEMYREFGREKDARRCDRRLKRLEARYEKLEFSMEEFLADEA